jgi:prephenate dehydrogenase
MLSTALAHSLGACEDREELLNATGPGLKSMTRLALSSWNVWKDILATNGDYIAEALREFHADLGRAAEELDEGALEERFRQGAEFAARLRKT